MTADLDLGTNFVESGVVGCAPIGKWIEFKNKGIWSPVYLNNRIWMDHPLLYNPVLVVLSYQVMRARMQLMELVGEDVAVKIGAVANGGTIHATLLADRHKLPLVVIHKTEKSHGAKGKIDGDVENAHVILVEDHVTTSGSLLEAAESVRSAGGKVYAAVSITNYEFPEVEPALKQAGVTLYTTVSFGTISAAMDRSPRFSSEQMDYVREWSRDPYAWTKEHAQAA